jgi:hypothetical protein
MYNHKVEEAFIKPSSTEGSLVTPAMREEDFELTGEFRSDEDIYKSYTLRNMPDIRPSSTGGKTDFYDIGDCKDVDDLAEHWNFKGDEFNCLKALVGIAKGSRHSGTDPIRDANKLVHYAQRILARVSK